MKRKTKILGTILIAIVAICVLLRTNVRANSEEIFIIQDLELKDILLEMYDENLDGEIQESEMLEITSLELYDYKGGLGDIQNITNLTNIYISSSKTIEYNIDMLNLKQATQIEELTLECNLDKISGIEEMTGLTNISLINKSISNKPTNQSSVIEIINQIDVENLSVSGDFIINLGPILLGTSKEFNLETISPIIASIKNEGDVLYNSSLEIIKGTSAKHGGITFDNIENNVNIIAKDTFSTGYVYFKTNNQEENGFFGRIQLKWVNAEDDDTRFEVDFRDNNLKAELLENYDLDNNGKITRFDMANIERLELKNKNISNITGLSSAYNAIYIDLSNNKITDASPLKMISNKSEGMYDLRDNYIEDISNLGGANFYNMNLGYNYIDVSEGTQNLQILNNNISRVVGENYDREPDCWDVSKEEAIASEQATAIDCFNRMKKYGTISERDDIIQLETNIKQRLIDSSVDSNNDGNITKGELLDYKVMDEGYFNITTLDLSDLNIENIDFTKYLTYIAILDLSNNCISNCTPLQSCNLLYELNLENNVITTLLGLEDVMSLEFLNLSNNHITDISGLSDFSTETAFYLDGIAGGYKYEKCISIDLSNNYIDCESDTTVETYNLIQEKGAELVLDNQNEIIVEVSKVYNEFLNNVEVTITSNIGFETTQIDWELSEDRTNYSKIYNENGEYSQQFTLGFGNTKAVEIVITEVDNIAPEIIFTKEYNEEENTVTVIATSNEILNEIKPSWILSEDKMLYIKKYYENGTYTTPFTDLYGNAENKSFEINEIQEKFKLRKQYDCNTNTVTVIVTSSSGFENTKPSWILSNDGKTYTKKYASNGTYSTPFVLNDGKVEKPTFEVVEIDDRAPTITITKQYNEQDNTVTVTAVSNEILAETKPTWTLSNDKMSYSKVYSKNGTYTTTYQDIYGNVISQTFTVNEIQTGFEVTKQYNLETNKVTVTATCDIGFQATKPSWTLSSDKKRYKKEYTANQTYFTPFVLSDGSIERPTIEVVEIDDVEPTITISQEYDEDTGIIKVKATSSEVLGTTKPSWTLSEDKMIYTKEYGTPGTMVTTPFADKYGNMVNVSFITGTEIKMDYNEQTKSTTVSVISPVGFSETKPTWRLNEDKTTYTKIYSSNGIYKTIFIFTDGTYSQLQFEIKN